MEIFIAQPDFGGIVDIHCYSWVDAIALEPAVLPESIALLVHRVKTYSDILINRLAGIEREAPVQKGPGLGRRLVYSLAIGLLQRPVHEATTNAPAEGNALGPFSTSTLWAL